MLRRIAWALGIVAIATSPAAGQDIKPATVPITGISCDHDLDPPTLTFESSKGEKIQWTVSVDGGKDGCQTAQKVLLCAYEKDAKDSKASKLGQPFHKCENASGFDMGKAFDVSPGETEQLLCKVKKVTAKKFYKLRAFVGSEVTANTCPKKEPKASHKHGRSLLVTHVLDTEIFP